MGCSQGHLLIDGSATTEATGTTTPATTNSLTPSTTADVSVALFSNNSGLHNFTGTNGWSCPVNENDGNGGAQNQCYKVLTTNTAVQATASVNNGDQWRCWQVLGKSHGAVAVTNPPQVSIF